MARPTLNSTSLLALLRGPSTLTAATFVASLALVACGDETSEKTEDTGTACNLFTDVGCEDTSADTTDTSTDTGTADTTEEDTNVDDTEVDTAVEDTTVDTGTDTGGVQ